MTVKDLKAYAQEKGIAIESKAKKLRSSTPSWLLKRNNPLEN